VLLNGDFLGVGEALAAFRLSGSAWSVRLVREQAVQVVGFHHAIAQEAPGLLSRMDLFRGDVRARGMAGGRRLAYVWLGRRMQAGTRLEQYRP
jgi:hypothetical protein